MLNNLTFCLFFLLPNALHLKKAKIVKMQESAP